MRERVRRLCEECVSGLIYISLEEEEEKAQQCTHSIDVGVLYR